MSLVAFSIKLDRIDESLLFEASDGSFWLVCVCSYEQAPGGGLIVAQSIPRERYAAGEKGPQVGFWREIGSKDKPPAGGLEALTWPDTRPLPLNPSRSSRRYTRRAKNRSRHRRKKRNASSRRQITRLTSMNSDFDMDADSRTLTKEEQWAQPDREAVIRDNPLLEYCQARGWRLKHDGAANRYKCLCPLRREKTPSFTIFADQGRFHCFGCGRKGNVIDLHAALKGVSGMEALCDLAGIEYHGAKRVGSARQTEKKNNTAQSQSGNAESYDPFKDPEKARKRQGWPAFETPSQAEIETSRHASRIVAQGVRSSLSEVCSFAPTQRKAAPGSSQIPAG